MFPNTYTDFLFFFKGAEPHQLAPLHVCLELIELLTLSPRESRATFIYLAFMHALIRLVTITGEGRKVDRPVKSNSQLHAQLSLHHNRPVKHLHSLLQMPHQSVSQSPVLLFPHTWIKPRDRSAVQGEMSEMRYELAELAVYELAVQKSEVPRKARVITRTIFSLITLLLANSEESGYLIFACSRAQSACKWFNVPLQTSQRVVNTRERKWGISASQATRFSVHLLPADGQ